MQWKQRTFSLIDWYSSDVCVKVGTSQNLAEVEIFQPKPTPSNGILSLLGSPLQILARADDRVFHRVAIAHTSRHRLHCHVALEAEKEWTRIALSTGLVDHAVHSRNEEIVRLSHETIRNVNHDASGDRRGFDPVA
jgi:hypothetical protein